MTQGPAEAALAALDALLAKCDEVLAGPLASDPVRRREFSGFVDGAQRQFRRFLTDAAAAATAATAATAAAATAAPKEEFSFRAIGVLRTPFVELNGTPRQAALAPDVPGVLELSPSVQPAHALSGLDGYSHCWLLTVFHANANVAYRPKVAPPLLGGAKTGVFATRSPHRPNNVALSLCRIEAVDAARGCVRLRGVDAVDGTPVLDLKPFVRADALTDAHWPAWLDSERLATGGVAWTDAARAQLRELATTLPGALRVLRSVDEAERCIEQCLRLDPRTVHAQQRHSVPVYGVALDGLNFVYQVDDATHSCTIVRVEPWVPRRPL